MEGESAVAQSRDNDEKRIQILLDWAKGRHIWVHDEAQVGIMVEHASSPSSSKESPKEQQGEARTEAHEASIDEGDEEEDSSEREKRAKGAGFGVFVRHGKQILERQVIVLVPKSTLLSARTASLAPYIPPDMLYTSDATSGLLLSLVLLHELLLGENGPWWGYLQSLPRLDGLWGIQLPLSLSKESGEWQSMAATEVGRMVKRAEADPAGRIEGLGMSKPRLCAFFKGKCLPILKKAHVDLFEKGDKQIEDRLLKDYIRAHSIISSRTFIVDMYHGMCLAPIADMFNHSEHANVHFEADDEVCDECGSLGACPHTDDPLPSEAYGRPSSILPARSGPNSEDWTPPEELKGVDTVDMVAQRDLDCDEEAYNTYGNFSNANLLTTYGFCLEYETEWERYVWEWRYKEERQEVLDALGMSRSRRAGEASSGELARVEWVKTCVLFTSLPRTTFAELLDDGHPLTQHSEPSPMVSMPVGSPFVALTQSPTQEAVETDLNPVLEDCIALLSTHDGSKDQFQPLYVDNEGRVSLSLWRAALLWSITTVSTGYSDDPTTAAQEEAPRIRKDVKVIEDNLSIVLTHKNADTPFDYTNDLRWELLHQTLSSLVKLVNRRIEAIKANRVDVDVTSTLSIIEMYEPGLIRSVAMQCFQEMTALKAGIAWLNRCLRIISKSAQT